VVIGRKSVGTESKENEGEGRAEYQREIMPYLDKQHN
jgi:hypothetical protein